MLLVPFAAAAALFLCAVLRLNVAVAEHDRVQFGDDGLPIDVASAAAPVLLVAQYLHLCRVRRGRNLSREEKEENGVINNFGAAFAVFPGI